MGSRSAAETWSRPMSAEEWWRFGSSPELSTEVQLCIEGDGAIDPAALAAAVAVASQSLPGTRLLRRGKRWADSGQAPDVHVVDAADFDRTRLDSPLLRNPLACGGRSSCEVLLVQGTPATLVFRAHPAVMDGRGVMLWQRQVFRALRGEAVEGASFGVTCDEVKAEIAAGLGIDLPPAAGPAESQWRSVLGKLPSGPRRSIWRRRTIDGVHPAVAAKIARLVAAYGDGDGTGKIGVPVDLRQYLPGLRTTAGVTGHVAIHIKQDDDWTDVQASLLTALNEHEFLAHPADPVVLSMPLPFMRELRRWLDNLARQNQDLVREKNLAELIAGVSPLGTVDLADLCADGFEATSCYCLGAVTYSPEIDIMECGGRTEVSVAWRDGPGVAGRAEALLDCIEEELSPRAVRVWDGNQTADGLAGTGTLTGLFAAQCARSPDAVAIRGPAGEMTYAQLAAAAAGTAAALTAAGIGRGDRVGLIAGRSAAAITAIWGILGAGAAYLPIDPGYPAARITALLTDASAPACLLEDPAATRGAVPAGCTPLALDTITAAAAPPGWQAPEAAAGDLACIIYTSGSTGAPKGVEIEHRALVNYTRWAIREARIGSATIMPLIASLSFDMAGCAIFLPLLAGGTVLPVPDVNAATLRDTIENSGATTLAITPSHLDLINASGIRHATLDVIMTAGELLRATTAARARQIFGPRCAILCQWGPTETTIVNTSHRYDPATDTAPGIPFGRPMDNNTIYLLDPHGRHVPPGQSGEACVAGPQLARGYLGHPQLTRHRFTRLADGTRIYHTGDLARLLPTGDLAFIARTDDQVKIAGHRIEPAEIAQALEQHPAITAAAVTTRTRPGHHHHELCAYITTTPASTGTGTGTESGTGTSSANGGGTGGPDAGEVKEFLATRLPRYMIPATITIIPAIPRTSNGKTDTRQLPDPFTTPHPGTGPGAPGDTGAEAGGGAGAGASGGAGAGASGGVPGAGERPGRDPVTAAIAGIWARTLHLDPRLIDDDTDFRDIGGTSLLMLTMINDVSRTITPHAPDHLMTQLARIIGHPTLTYISNIARQTQTTHQTPALTDA